MVCIESHLLLKCQLRSEVSKWISRALNFSTLRSILACSILPVFLISVQMPQPAERHLLGRHRDLDIVWSYRLSWSDLNLGLYHAVRCVRYPSPEDTSNWPLYVLKRLLILLVEGPEVGCDLDVGGSLKYASMAMSTRLYFSRNFLASFVLFKWDFDRPPITGEHVN